VQLGEKILTFIPNSGRFYTADFYHLPLSSDWKKIASDQGGGVVIGQAKKKLPAAHQKTNIPSQKITSDQGVVVGLARSLD
jgi:hypothetical protein